MKKFISLALALIMVFSLATVALAEEQEDLDGSNNTQTSVAEDASPLVPKTYQINNGTAPAETFTFTFEGLSYKDGDGTVTPVSDTFTIPSITPVTISYDAISETLSKSGTASVSANDYNLGVYTYKVTETAGNTAGVTYSTEELYLVLTVVRHEDNGKHYFAAMHYQSASGTDKSTGFTNAYDSGSLTVTKHITGNMADMNKKFTFTVVFSAPTGKTVKSDISTTTGMTVDSVTYNDGGSADGWTTATYVFQLGHNGTMTFSNLPAGVTYTVSENSENYTQKDEAYSDENKTISAGDADTYSVTNVLQNQVDTGITLDTLPFVLILAVCAGAVVLFVIKRRRSVDF